MQMHMNTLQVPTGPTQGPSNGLAAVLIYPYTLLVSEAQGATTVVLFNKDDGSIRTSPSPWGRRCGGVGHEPEQHAERSRAHVSVCVRVRARFSHSKCC